jgi:PhnB protein
MSVTTYLHFSGNCEEAVKFYEQTLGAKVPMLLRYKDMPADAAQEASEHAEGCQQGQGPDPAMAEKIMHGRLEIGDSILMVSDGPDSGNFHGFSLSLEAETPEQGKPLFDALSEGGQVLMPFAPTFWADAFGMVQDRFGLRWMVNVSKPGMAP